MAGLSWPGWPAERLRPGCQERRAGSVGRRAVETASPPWAVGRGETPRWSTCGSATPTLSCHWPPWRRERVATEETSPVQRRSWLRRRCYAGFRALSCATNVSVLGLICSTSMLLRHREANPSRPLSGICCSGSPQDVEVRRVKTANAPKRQGQ
ncbi:hypothetical protein K458DRAFT_460453 [Lentithecium fluviatile CBS 122367]|uniref:Uncharacterized protein n=1 Tax=Lentithecium fluviatile CBS 122367 TaxID=1168545 RepID=A0A6G1IPZ8_9PLEO|nr:hypothetical protein K458DRAFT_460453 [Lentithecium fluviatile CBS 122367]